MLQQIVTQRRHTVSFDEKQWLMKNFKKADLDRNGQISFNELWKLLKKLNLQMSTEYVRKLYDVSVGVIHIICITLISFTGYY